MLRCNKIHGRICLGLGNYRSFIHLDLLTFMVERVRQKFKKKEREGLGKVAVINWLCDCCGLQFGIDDQRVMFVERMSLAEDRCTKCMGHLDHCMKIEEQQGN